MTQEGQEKELCQLPDYQQECLLPDYRQEVDYLARTLALLRQQLQSEQQDLSRQSGSLIEAKKEWVENTLSGKYYDANQYLESVQMMSSTQSAAQKRLQQCEASLDSPYFARFDFQERGYGPEKIYIGLHSVCDEDSYETYVYDWRAPISSIFYRYELGPAQYQAPMGLISGQVSLKRQYEIKKGQLLSYFDSSISIQDEILREVLSRNASPQMRNIVETIQRQQDEIIRDSEHDLLLVQGVAGSGKTSVALHRIAYLMYQGLHQALTAENVLVLSPNALFGRYIAQVLPELGEEAIQSLTFEELFRRKVYWAGQLESRLDYLEALTSSQNEEENTLRRQGCAFFLSPAFATVLERYAREIPRQLPYEDVYYDGKVLLNRRQLQDFVENNLRRLPLETALQNLSEHIWAAVHLARKERRQKLLELYSASKAHRYDAPTYARYVSIRESLRLKERLQPLCSLDVAKLFQALLAQPERFQRLSQGLELPENWKLLLRRASAAMEAGRLEHGAAFALLYLKLQLSSSGDPAIRQVVVDEAQDYEPLHFRILGQLYPQARFTVLGDVNQALEKDADLELYGRFAAALGKKNSVLLSLNKGFRSTYEINRFSQRFLSCDTAPEAFDRHGQEPRLWRAKDEAQLEELLLWAAEDCRHSGCASVAILTKTMERAKELAQRLSQRTDCRLVSDHSSQLGGLCVLPLYLAKGLEFDGALLDEVNAAQYSSPLDKKLLYISATRPLHRLELFCCGEPSPLLAGLAAQEKLPF